MSLPRKIGIGFLLFISIYLIIQGNFIEKERNELYIKATSTIAEVIDKEEVKQIKHTTTKTVTKNGKSKRVSSTSYSYEQEVTLEYKYQGNIYTATKTIDCPSKGIEDDETFTVYVNKENPNEIYFDDFGSGIGLIYSGYVFLGIIILTSIKPIINMIKNKKRKEIN